MQLSVLIALFSFIFYTVHLKNELTAIKKAKELSVVIFEVTEKSPKKFKFTLVSRMQNLSLDIISELYNANDVFVESVLLANMEKSINFAKRKNNYTNVIEWLFYKNKLYSLQINKALKADERITKRLDYSYNAMTKTKQLDFLVCLSAQTGCITQKQRERLAGLLYEVRCLIGAFIKSDKKRFNY